jgi:hypothetical protein
VQGRSYAAGIAEYLELAEHLMRRKEMPESLITMALDRYRDAAAVAERRRVASRYAEDAFALTEEQLACLVSSPFTDRGAALGPYLERCHPERAADLDRLHAVLRGDATDPAVTTWLESVSGLLLRHLQALYRSARLAPSRPDTLIARVLVDDPHKKAVRTVDVGTGRPTVEVMSGR